jgi:hypothetical protein
MQYRWGMPSLADDLVKTHRVEQAKRERAWMVELEQRRHAIAMRACIDVEALRAKLGV